MENLYQQTCRLLSETQKQMHELSTFSRGNEQALESRVWDNLQQLNQDCYRLEMMVRKEPPAKRQEAKYRVDQLVADIRVVQNAHRSYQQRKSAAELETRQREELLSRRFTPNSADGDTSIQMDHSLHHHQRLRDSNHSLDQLVGSASGILTNLKTQDFTLKRGKLCLIVIDGNTSFDGARRKILDVANTLGLSNTVMRLIEKRTAQDRWIFWGGVLITVTIIILVIMYLL